LNDAAELPSVPTVAEYLTDTYRLTVELDEVLHKVDVHIHDKREELRARLYALHLAEDVAFLDAAAAFKKRLESLDDTDTLEDFGGQYTIDDLASMRANAGRSDRG
jgi:hypothetical protein